MQLSSIEHDMTRGIWSLVMISNETRRVYRIPVEWMSAKEIIYREGYTILFEDTDTNIREYSKRQK